VVRGLRVDRGRQTIVRDLDLDVAPGQIRALMGVSGVGKTTVLRALVALQPFSAGSVIVGDVSLTAGPLPPQSRLHALRRRIGLVFQGASLFEHLTVLENMTLAPVHALGWSLVHAEEVARRLLTQLGVDSRADALPRQLSGGEAQRVAIARAMMLDPTLLLMDEPTSALDPARRGSLAAALRQLAREGRALLIATHDVDFARAVADDILVLSDGRIVEQGPAAAVLASPKHQATRELLQQDGR
jgi:ABC-type polar amino acid transport system ATPase subunit